MALVSRLFHMLLPRNVKEKAYSEKFIVNSQHGWKIWPWFEKNDLSSNSKFKSVRSLHLSGKHVKLKECDYSHLKNERHRLKQMGRLCLRCPLALKNRAQSGCAP